MRQSEKSFSVIVVDNGSTDGSRELIREKYPWAELLCLEENTGFCGAVNRGIQAAEEPYVILLNNDTEAEPDFIRELLEGIGRHRRAFACGAKMLQAHSPELLDDAGDFYSALGWAAARGKGKPEAEYSREEKIFSACAGAAIYRRKVLLGLGLFDEEHFAYLEDLDICYRARLHGYENWYLPKARVRHVGSGTSGSRYNLFKVRYSSRNNIYLIWKNMPLFQILLNLPFLLAGFGAKFFFSREKDSERSIWPASEMVFSCVGNPKKRRNLPGNGFRYTAGFSWNCGRICAARFAADGPLKICLKKSSANKRLPNGNTYCIVKNGKDLGDERDKG